MKKTINIEEIFFKHIKKLKDENPNENWFNDEEMKESPEYVHYMNIIKEVCNEALILACENAVLIKYTDNFGDPDKYLDEQSILDTIKQIV